MIPEVKLHRRGRKPQLAKTKKQALHQDMSAELQEPSD